MNRIFTVLAFGALLAASACAPRTPTITIIAVNDMHAAAERFPRLATLVRQYRAADSLHTLLVDAGDRWTGNPYVDRGLERGLPMVELQNALGFDLSTLGNHEFDFGVDNLARRMGEARFRFTSANVDSNGSGMPQPDPYTMIEVDGVKFCFMGLLTTARAGYPDGFVENFGTVRFSNPITSALAHREVRRECDVMVGLTHIGFALDTLLARQMPELDLIVGGHSHTTVPDDTRVGGVLVTQTGSRLTNANVITVEMRGRRVASTHSRLVNLDSIAPDPEFTAMVERYYDQPELRRVAGEMLTPLDHTGIMNMTSDIIRQGTASDLAIYNHGGIRSDTLKAGPLTVADFYSLEPFGNMVTVMRLTKEQLAGLIRNTVKPETMLPGREDIIPSGFTYSLRMDADGKVEVTLDIPSRPGPDGTYSVATSDYLDKTYDFEGAGTGTSTGIVVADMLMAHFGKQARYTGDNVPRASTAVE